MTNLIALPSGTELVGDYRIERVLGAGGFGITYLADEIALARMVTIKEYFPADFAARDGGIDAAPRSQDCAGDYRWGLDRFIEEAQTLAKFDHPNIVRVYRYFRANNTGYMVLHFEEGQSFKAWLKGLRRAPRQKELDAIIAPLLDALELIHKADFLHRDIAPDNIIIRKDGSSGADRLRLGTRRDRLAHQDRVGAGEAGLQPLRAVCRDQPPAGPVDRHLRARRHALSRHHRQAPARRALAHGQGRATFRHAKPRSAPIEPASSRPSTRPWRSTSKRGRNRSRHGAATCWRPDPVRASWLTRTTDRRKNRKKDKEEAEPFATVAATVPIAPAPSVTPPPPDAPGPKGGLLDFLEGLRKKPDGDAAPAAAPVPIQIAAASTPLAQAATVKLEAPPAPVLKKKSQSKKPIPKERALVVVKSPPRPRPRRLKGSRPSLMPIVFKLLVGVGVASAAVAMQDRFPQFESRGSAVTTGITTGTTNPLPQAQIPALVTPIAEVEAHRGSISGAVYSDDGRRIVTTGADGTMKVWDAEHRSLVRTIELDDGPATSLALSGGRALTGHTNGKVVLWDIDRAEKIATVQRNEANIWAVAFTGDPNRFATASHDWKVTLWDARQASAPLQVLDGHENSVQSLAYSPQRLLLASGSADRTVRVWDLDTLTLKRSYSGPRDFVTSVAFSQSGKLLAAGSLDGRIQIWSVLSQRRLRALSGHRGRVADIAFSPSGDQLASAGEDGTVRLWDLQRGRIVRALTGHLGGATAVAFAPDGQHLASAGVDGRLRLWAIPLGQLARE